MLSHSLAHFISIHFHHSRFIFVALLLCSFIHINSHSICVLFPNSSVYSYLIFSQVFRIFHIPILFLSYTTDPISTDSHVFFSSFLLLLNSCSFARTSSSFARLSFCPCCTHSSYVTPFSSDTFSSRSCFTASTVSCAIASFWTNTSILGIKSISSLATARSTISTCASARLVKLSRTSLATPIPPNIIPVVAHNTNNCNASGVCEYSKIDIGSFPSPFAILYCWTYHWNHSSQPCVDQSKVNFHAGTTNFASFDFASFGNIFQTFANVTAICEISDTASAIFHFTVPHALLLASSSVTHLSLSVINVSDHSINASAVLHDKPAHITSINHLAIFPAFHNLYNLAAHAIAHHISHHHKYAGINANDAGIVCGIFCVQSLESNISILSSSIGSDMCIAINLASSSADLLISSHFFFIVSESISVPIQFITFHNEPTKFAVPIPSASLKLSAGLSL